VWREPALGAGGGTFVLATLATVVFDGISQTNTYSLWEADLFEWQVWFSYHITLFQTLFMVAIVGGFALLYLAICVVLSRSDEDRIGETARRYAPTLIPISAVYFVAHYFLYLVYVGQFTGSAVLDPLEREWVPDYTIWAGVPGALVWYLQVALIVWGHVVAVFAAHRLALRDDRRPAGAVLRQSPLVLLMAGYTFLGLWVLGQSLGPSG